MFKVSVYYTGGVLGGTVRLCSNVNRLVQAARLSRSVFFRKKKGTGVALSPLAGPRESSSKCEVDNVSPFVSVGLALELDRLPSHPALTAFLIPEEQSSPPLRTVK